LEGRPGWGEAVELISGRHPCRRGLHGEGEITVITAGLAGVVFLSCCCYLRPSC
jgi:hypothetical protein